jgi:hypothetical protein
MSAYITSGNRLPTTGGAPFSLRATGSLPAPNPSFVSVEDLVNDLGERTLLQVTVRAADIPAGADFVTIWVWIQGQDEQRMPIAACETIAPGESDQVEMTTVIPAGWLSGNDRVVMSAASIDSGGNMGPAGRSVEVYQPALPVVLGSSPVVVNAGGGAPRAGAQAWVLESDVAVENAVPASISVGVLVRANAQATPVFHALDWSGPTALAGQEWAWRVRAQNTAGAPFEFVGPWTAVAASVAAPPDFGEGEVLDDTNSELLTLLGAGGVWYQGVRITDPDHPAHAAQGGVDYLAWSHTTEVIDAETGELRPRRPSGEANKGVRHAAFSDSESPNYSCYELRLNQNFQEKSWADKTGTPSSAAPERIALTWSSTPDTTDVAAAEWADWGPIRDLQIAPPAGLDPGSEPEPDPDPDPVPIATTGSKRMPFQNEAEWNASQQDGYIGGDALQLMTWVEQSRSNPNYIVKTQDMGGPWVSLDHGRSWWKPRCKGLRTQLMNSVGIDPIDHLHWTVVGTGAWAGVTPFQGLYRTLDGGQTFVRTFTFSGVEGKDVGGLVAAGRSSGSGGIAQRWYALVNRQAPGSGGVQPGIYFLRSTNGAATWTQVGSIGSGSDILQLGTHGIIRQVVVHPTDPNIVFFASSTGLWRITNAGGSTPTVTRISVTGLSGGFSTLPYVEMVGGNLHIVVGNGGGIRKSTDGGNSWSTVSSQSVSRLFVSRWEPEFMVATGRAGRPLVRNGGSFSESAAVPARPGYPRTSSPAETGASWIIFSPRAGEMYFKARGIVLQNADFRSSNYGASWAISNDYFSGTQSQVTSSTGQGFSRNRSIFGIGIVDAGVCVTRAAGRHWRRSDISLAALNISHRSCTAFAIHPDYPAVPIILAIMDRTSGGKFAMCNREDLSGWFRPSGVSSSSTKTRFIGWDVSNAQFAYAIRSRSTNGGAAWSTLGGLPANFEIWGITRNAALANGQAVFAFDNEGTAQRVARSLDRGVSWAVILDFGSRLLNLPGAEAAGAFLPHPSNHNRLFVRGGGSTVRLYRLDEGSGTSRPFTTIQCAPSSISAQMAAGASFDVAGFAVDPRYPNQIWYATNSNPGTGVPMVRTTDGGSSWENLAGLVPDNNLTFMDVHPLTGDVVLTSSNGAFVIAPPYAQAGSIHDGLVQPNRILPLAA